MLHTVFNPNSFSAYTHSPKRTITVRPKCPRCGSAVRVVDWRPPTVPTSKPREMKVNLETEVECMICSWKGTLRECVK